MRPPSELTPTTWQAKAGIVMAVALTIEMTFLGLTFSASISALPFHMRGILIAVGPLFILFGGVIGAATAAALTANPVLQAGEA
jgi:zinc transporter, ZIP family